MACIKVENLSKRFILRKDRADSVGKLIVRMLPRGARSKAEPFWALRDVSFEVPQGKSLGIVGRNGSGKSTLLKLITRTMRPTAGTIETKGKISALIELGAGFHPDFTGRENVILSASLFGIRRREIERRLDDIIDFADIRRFIDTPTKYYSSGMLARLGFSAAIHVEPDILVVDEILAVGDAAFAQRCMERILGMKARGVSILLVTHDVFAVRRLMDEALWIDHGGVMTIGDPVDTTEAYLQSLVEPEAPAERAEELLGASPR